MQADWEGDRGETVVSFDSELKDTQPSELIGLKVFPLASGFGAMSIIMLIKSIAWFAEGYVRKIRKWSYI